MGLVQSTNLFTVIIIPGNWVTLAMVNCKCGKRAFADNKFIKLYFVWWNIGFYSKESADSTGERTFLLQPAAARENHYMTYSFYPA